MKRRREMSMDVCLGVRGRAKEIEGVTTSKIEIAHTVQNSRGGMGRKETWMKHNKRTEEKKDI